MLGKCSSSISVNAWSGKAAIAISFPFPSHSSTEGSVSFSMAATVSAKALEREEKSASSRVSICVSADSPAENEISFAVTGPKPRQASLIAFTSFISFLFRKYKTNFSGVAARAFNFPSSEGGRYSPLGRIRRT